MIKLTVKSVMEETPGVIDWTPVSPFPFFAPGPCVQVGVVLFTSLQDHFYFGNAGVFDFEFPLKSYLNKLAAAKKILPLPGVISGNPLCGAAIDIPWSLVFNLFYLKLIS
jgi:hypothetical protein